MGAIKKFIAIILIMGALPLFSEEEIKKIEQLIKSTEMQLEKNKELKKMMILFEEQKTQFMKGEETFALAAAMVKNATAILGLISENHLQYLFSSEYMEELALFTSIGAKKSPTRP